MHTGYKPFARAAIKGKQMPSEIARYINKIVDPEEKYNLLCEAEMWKQAIEEAVKLKDVRRILNVKNLCNDAELQLLADQMIGRVA